jgi:tape measure domain-containing protein
MAKASDLNVRLGLIFDEKALGQAERSLRRAGDRLTKVGNEMMTGLTLPLGLFGASAIKAAGDLESLTLALQSQTGSAAKASEELQKLTEVSRNPGLGLEQSVRASIRLQSVGIAADEARGIITQLGNAIASTGGTAQEFDSVTRQFSQMISKGKILQEDISIISENMPVISQLMQKAFGTANVEAIREMGIGAKEFVTQITAAASELPRVGGGIKNNLANVIDELQISLGKVGLAIEKAFNVTGNLTNFAVWLGDVAAAFSSLNPAVQSAILYFGAFLIAIGPIAKTIGNIQLVSSVLTGVWAKLLPKVQDLTKWLGLQRAAFIALTPATQAFVAIGLAVAIGTMAYNMGLFNRELTASEKALAKVNELTQQAKSDTAAERLQVQQLIEILKDENQGRENKISALEKLKQISPEYFGQLDIEKLSVEKLTGAYDGYVNSLVMAARAKRAEGELIKIDEELQKALEAKTKAQKAYNYMVSVGRATSDEAGALVAANEQVDALQRQFNAIKNVIYQEQVRQGVIKAAPPRDFSGLTGLKMESDELRQNSLLYKLNSEAVNKATTAKSTFKQVTDGATEGTKKNTKAQKELNDELEKTASIQSKPIPNFGQLPTLPTPTSVQSENQPEAPDFSGIQSSANEFYKKQLEQQANQKERLKEQWSQLAVDAVYALDQLFGAFEARQLATLEKSYKAQLAAAGDSTTKRAAIEAEYEAKREELQKKAGKRKKAFAMAEAAMNTAVAITKTYSEFGFPIGLPLAIAQGALGAAQIAMIAATPFARGTQFAPGGMALVGEQGPELMNVPRGSQILSNNRTNRALEGINSQANISGEFTVRGTDLVLVLEKAQSKQKRIF